MYRLQVSDTDSQYSTVATSTSVRKMRIEARRYARNGDLQHFKYRRIVGGPRKAHWERWGPCSCSAH